MSSNQGPDAPVGEVGGAPALIGCRCASCGTHEFPRQTRCARCGSTMEPAELPTEGTLWTWTVQHFQPKRIADPASFAPFALGYVDLGIVKVETRLAGRPLDGWTIGDRLRLAVPGPDDPASPPFWFEPAPQEVSA